MADPIAQPFIDALDRLAGTALKSRRADIAQIITDASLRLEENGVPGQVIETPGDPRDYTPPAPVEDAETAALRGRDVTPLPPAQPDDFDPRFATSPAQEAADVARTPTGSGPFAGDAELPLPPPDVLAAEQAAHDARLASDASLRGNDGVDREAG